MHKLLILALLLSPEWVQAQPAGPSSDKNKTASLTTIDGCLQSADNEFTLTESDGTSHTLAGNGNKLNHQVGHQVEITGKPGIRTVDTTPVGGASSAKEIPVFEVKSLKQIADTCKGY